MDKNKLIIDTGTEIEIEVMNGFIYLDGQDVELGAKIEALYATFQEGHKALQAQEIIIEKETNEKIKNEKKINATIAFIDSCYKSINELFGKGAHHKIFRSKTIAGVEIFLNALPPYLEQIQGLTVAYFDKRTAQDVKDKYAPRNELEEVIEEVE